MLALGQHRSRTTKQNSPRIATNELCILHSVYELISLLAFLFYLSIKIFMKNMLINMYHAVAFSIWKALEAFLWFCAVEKVDTWDFVYFMAVSIKMYQVQFPFKFRR